MAEVKSQVHVQIRRSDVLRKELLESSLECMELIQFYERLKSLRKEKNNLISKFKGLIGEINTLVQQLDFQELPEIEVSVKEQKKIKQEVKEKTKPNTIEVPKKARTQIESEIEEIRAKLENLHL
jgi:predicted nuclease with TOPRIM domain